MRDRSRPDVPLRPKGPTPEYWYRAQHASGFVGLRFGATFRAYLTHRVVDERLQFIGIGLDVTRLDVLHGAMKNMSTDGLLDELRKVTLFHALRAQKGAQGQIGFLRDFDVPADCFLLHATPM